MRVLYITHAFTSCWNNGNAHFLRGVARELVKAGHHITICEPQQSWSRLNALQDGGAEAIDEVRSLIGGVDLVDWADAHEIESLLDGADVVIVHEWTPPELVARIGDLRIAGGRFTLLFHDTHHRAVTAPEEMARFDLEGYDGVLAFGAVLRDIYSAQGWGRRAFVWHEAADTELYRPMPEIAPQCDLVWIGNWGDNERSAELMTYLIEPVRTLSVNARIFGVRYPDEALNAIASAHIHYGGWLPNHRAPRAFAEARSTVHVPRGPYARQLPGIPTIRMFEALACGVPLVSAPWNDDEGLFPEGCYLRASSGETMTKLLSAILNDRALAESLSRNGLDVIERRHTCRHRVEELLHIIDNLRRPEQRLEHVQQQELAS
jgi:spore maturation protein CgeB